MKWSIKVKVAYIIHDARFLIRGDMVYTKSNANQSFWSRYQDCFDKVVIVARTCKIDEDYEISDEFNTFKLNKFFQLKAIPYFEGPLGYFKKYFEIRAFFTDFLEFLVNESIDNSVNLIIRSPTSFFINGLKRINYSVEVVGDSWDSVTNYNNNLVNRIVAFAYSLHQKNVVAKAMAASYVTQKRLQARFPPLAARVVSNYSSINLPADKFSEIKSEKLLEKYRNLTSNSYMIKTISVGSLESQYKGADILLKALRDLVDEEVKICHTWIGGGKYLKHYIEQSKSYNLTHHINFMGQQDFATIHKELNDSDIFILPSLQEGLPRALIEAMAQSLVCIGSDIGGVNELIDSKYIFEPGNPADLKRKLLYLLSCNPHENAENAERNFKFSLQFEKSLLEDKRRIFYKNINDLAKI